MTGSTGSDPLFRPLALPCGQVLKNRIAKSAMSDGLGDGTGRPSAAQMRLYRRWAAGGAAVSIIGEVQSGPRQAEAPGNLVLHPGADPAPLRALAEAGTAEGGQLWLQLGHAGALSHGATGLPRGPSALDLPGLRCAEIPAAEIAALPGEQARAARMARDTGFGGVQIHAAHGFLLGQFLSPLFNRRSDGYGGTAEKRMRLLLEVAGAVRAAVGPDFPVAVKLNSSDQLEGGFAEAEALRVIAALGAAKIDLLDISGGTYFPGAAAASDSAGKGPYFLGFARLAREVAEMPLMATGGFKTYCQARAAVAEGSIDMAGLARALALDPALPAHWQAEGSAADPDFPRFRDPPPGGVTAWYAMRLAEIAGAGGGFGADEVQAAAAAWQAREAAQSQLWNRAFGAPG
ncbi:oxidoreductase [Poseidonocella sp. HB161398]|uniref:oxidoreductase n=1 Tax=Poseidonocella sp. HB161398 TaxID=2320855 RepID=UPI001108CCA0|nr:oxidoreductase [Poseidonocella sp. HB161398]